MTITDLHFETSRPDHPEWPEQPGAGRSGTALLTVVGFDGSAPSLAALEAATQLIRGRNGHLEIVYVAHLPAYVGMSAAAVVGTREGFNDIADELDATARAALNDREPRWHFQRRNGSITEELVAAASGLHRQHGQDATTVIIVGASAHLAHRFAGSVAVALARNAGFPLLVVPAAPAVAHAAVRVTEASSFLG